MLLCSSAFSLPCGKHEHVQVEAGKVSRKLSEEFVERFDMGEGRFVEKRGAKQLIVGAKDDAEADEVYTEWKAEVLRRALEIEKGAKEMTPEELAEQEARQARRKAAEEEEAARLEEERKKREDEARRKAEQEKEDEARRKEEEEEAKKRDEELTRWLRARGFTGVNDRRNKKKGCCVCACGRDNNVYPLHVAAELADARIVELLLEEGADRTMTSSGRTPVQVALKHNKAGSHDAVIQLLRGEGGKPQSGGA